MTKGLEKGLILNIVPNKDKLEKEILINFEPKMNGLIKPYLLNRGIILSITITIFLISLFCIISYYYGYLSSISPIMLAPISFLLIIALGSYNSENKKNELLNIFKKELTTNLVDLIQNNNRIIDELSRLKAGEPGHYRLTKIEFDMYELLRQTFPKRIVNMKHMETYISRSKKANNSIIFREKMIIHQIDQVEDIIMLDEELMDIIREIIEYICILLGSNLTIAERCDNNNFRTLSETKKVINFLDSRIKLYYGNPKDPKHSERVYLEK